VNVFVKIHSVSCVVVRVSLPELAVTLVTKSDQWEAIARSIMVMMMMVMIIIINYFIIRYYYLHKV
jgi:hypothetical protein